jgi:hypothetical protein
MMAAIYYTLKKFMKFRSTKADSISSVLPLDQKETKAWFGTIFLVFSALFSVKIFYDK